MAVETEKEHVVKVKNSKFVRQRETDTNILRANCGNQGYVFTINGVGAYQCAFHHILAVSSLQDGKINPQATLDFFHDCMAVTVWDTNLGPNLIGLPRKSVYAHADVDADHVGAVFNQQFAGLANALAGSGGFGAVPDLPCHEVEHNIYNQEQVIDLQANIWEPLSRSREDCKVDPKSILGELEGSSVAWRQFLTLRGAECQGAAHCWKNRNEPGYDAFWFKPFSMNPGDARKAIAPQKATEIVQDWINALFK